MTARTITVIARYAGFRRGGRAWAAEPTTVPVEEFSASQLAAIRAEPLLMVHESGGDPAEASEASPGSQSMGDDPAAGSDPAAGDPSHDAGRDQEIAAAMDRLDPDDPAHFRRDGRPEVAAIRRAGGPQDVTAADRDRVWDAIRGA